jgi:uncharacterized membrane protein YidH (DUF202 family)
VSIAAVAAGGPPGPTPSRPPSSRRIRVAAGGLLVAAIGVVVALLGIEPWNPCHTSLAACADLPQRSMVLMAGYTAIIVGIAISAVELCLAPDPARPPG